MFFYFKKNFAKTNIKNLNKSKNTTIWEIAAQM
jgi:hypothetical protein